MSIDAYGDYKIYHDIYVISMHVKSLVCRYVSCDCNIMYIICMCVCTLSYFILVKHSFNSYFIFDHKRQHVWVHTTLHALRKRSKYLSHGFFAGMSSSIADFGSDTVQSLGTSEHLTPCPVRSLSLDGHLEIWQSVREVAATAMCINWSCGQI